MKYQEIVQAEFVERENRFVAYVKLNGQIEKVHVKNTGRCAELLVPGARVWLEKSPNKERSTAYDLVTVEKNGRIINMDSQAPNQVVKEWLSEKKFFPDLVMLQPEKTYGKSRFDFYAETEKEKVFIEVKGVTLENQGIVKFPDAPSERAVKHLDELIAAKKDGYRACVIFVIQMKDIQCFFPNRDTHKEFADALVRAERAGVELYAYDCQVTPDSLQIDSPVPVYLKEPLEFVRLSKISEPLLAWYDQNRRILPWREEASAYRVWVSEIMLQQTRVEAVKPYFERFINELPNVSALAAAREEQLLKLWEGLGYYNRVRNLQKAAVQVMEQYGGEIPSDYEELLQLSGIGSYTAGAISSIAFGRLTPAVDGNVLRVLSRIRKDPREITDAKVKKEVEEELKLAMSPERPGDFNQAMMEIGACVCIPNGAPKCNLCPFADICLAHLDSEELAYPRKTAKKKRSIEKKTILVIRDAEETVIKKRDSKGLLAGMYEFPSIEGHCSAEEVMEYLSDAGLKVLRVIPLEDAKHVFTHKEWHMQGYLVRVDELEPASPNEKTEDWIYIKPEEISRQYPVPTAFAAYTGLLSIKLGKDIFSEE